jgi:DNA-directed RNA polymerase subunit F
MTKRVQQDIKQSRYDEKKILRHEDAFEVCEENKCRMLKRKLSKTAGEEKVD